MLRIFFLSFVELSAGGHGQDERLLYTDGVHRADPLVNFLGGLGVGVRVHVDDRILRLGNQGDGNLVDRLRAVVLEEDGFRGCRNAGGGQRIGFFRISRPTPGYSGQDSHASSPFGPLQERSAIHGASEVASIICAANPLVYVAVRRVALSNPGRAALDRTTEAAGTT